MGRSASRGEIQFCMTKTPVIVSASRGLSPIALPGGLRNRLSTFAWDLNVRCSQSGIACFRDALFAIDRTALPGVGASPA